MRMKINLASRGKIWHFRRMATTLQTTPRPLGQNCIARMSTIQDMSAMLSALSSAGCFYIEKTPQTVIVTHPQSNAEVLRGLAKGPGGPWIVRYDRRLFA